MRSKARGFCGLLLPFLTQAPFFPITEQHKPFITGYKSLIRENSGTIRQNKTLTLQYKTAIRQNSDAILQYKTAIRENKTLILQYKTAIRQNSDAILQYKTAIRQCNDAIRKYKTRRSLLSYIPAKEADFVDWSENLITVSEAHVADWNLPQAKLTELRTLNTEVKRLHVLCKTAGYTKVDMEDKNEKKAVLIGKEEVFARNNLQNNDLMTDAGREELQIPKHDKTITHHGAPDEVPDIEVLTPLPRTVRLRFRALNAPRWGKHKNAHGLECL
ncbi:hypothetical protein ACYULU_05875, partial [Breznakiellaceae bacterium SP9]